MTSAEALMIVREICKSTKNAVITPLLEKLQDAFPHTPFIDLIYHHPSELTPEQIVDEAFKREAEHVAQSGGGVNLRPGG